jgi:hypothetical protein
MSGTRDYIWLVKALSTLALLVARVLANNPDDALAPDDLALPADLLH